jgi:cytochrome o ubiquinol oxidase subunit 1
VGFYLAFMPLYALGLMGATRRMQHYPEVHWQPLMLVALAGAVVILLGIALTVVQIAVSIRERRATRDRTGDPWDGRTLEWSMPSPPPVWNFSLLPEVAEADAYWHVKEAGMSRHALKRSFVDLHVPRNTPVGVFIAFFAVILGFALIWRIYWLAAVGLIGAVAAALWQFWKTDREIHVPAEAVAAFERTHAPLVHDAPAAQPEPVTAGGAS